MQSSYSSRSDSLVYYVDHRDPNAATRAFRLLPHLPDNVTVLSEAVGLCRRLQRQGINVRSLNTFADQRQGAGSYPGEAVYDWILRHRPATVLCDAPFESNDFAPGGIQLIRLRRPGYEPEERLYRQYGNAHSVLSLATDWFESRQTPDWLRAKTYYTGCLPDPDCQSEDREAARAACGFAPDKRYVVVLKANAHSSFPLAQLAEAARHTPEHEWVRLGPVTNERLPDNLQQVGMVPDRHTYLHAADVVVSDADETLLHHMAACGTPLICLPDPDARHAQHTYAHALRKRGVALAYDIFPPAFKWPSLLRRAAKMKRAPWPGFYAEDPGSRVQLFLEQLKSAQSAIGH